MSTLSIDRPSINQVCAGFLNAIWTAPERVAHAHEMSQAAEQVFAMSDEELATRGLTRRDALYRIAQSV